MNQHSEPLWIACKNIPSNIGTRSFCLHNHHSIILTSRNNLRLQVRQYNAHTDEWQEPVTSQEIGSGSVRATACQSAQLLVRLTDELVRFDFKSGTFTSRNASCCENVYLLFVYQSRLACIEGNSESCARHLMWDDKQNKLTCTAGDFGITEHYAGWDSIRITESVFVPSMHMVVAVVSAWTVYDNQHVDEQSIWSFSLQSLKWTKRLKVEIKVWYGNTALSSNQRFLIMLDYHSNALFILDLKLWKLKKTRVNLPEPLPGGCSKMLRTGDGLMDERIVFQWIRELFKSPAFKQMHAPRCIVQMISKCYYEETIHLLCGKTYDRIREDDQYHEDMYHEADSKHFAIKLKHFL